MTNIKEIVAIAIASLFTLMVIVGICVLLGGISNTSSATDKDNNKQDYITDEFMKIKSNDLYNDDYFVIVHKRTRTMYLVYRGMNAVAIELLVDANGNPLLYEGEIKNG